LVGQLVNQQEEAATMDLTQQVADLPSVDAEYCFGKPKTYLTARELARLMLLRSRLGDTQRERAAEAPPVSVLPRATSKSKKRSALSWQRQSQSESRSS
jgi:hypothetical protein